MTVKQKEYLDFIYDMTGIEFKGNSNNNKEILEYINRYKNNPNNFDSSWAIVHGY